MVFIVIEDMLIIEFYIICIMIFDKTSVNLFFSHFGCLWKHSAVLRDHSGEGLGDHIWCLALNFGWAHVKKVLFAVLSLQLIYFHYF